MEKLKLNKQFGKITYLERKQILFETEDEYFLKLQREAFKNQ